MAISNNPHEQHLPMLVVDVLRYDIEQVPAIRNLLNNTGSVGWRKFWPLDFTDSEVIDALQRLVREGLVEVLVYDPQRKELVFRGEVSRVADSLEEYWFRLNDEGRKKWEAWDPPTEPLEP